MELPDNLQHVYTRCGYGLTYSEVIWLCASDRDCTLCTKLDNLEGIRNADFNAHFGPWVFFSADHERAAREAMGMIAQFLRNHESYPVEEP